MLRYQAVDFRTPQFRHVVVVGPAETVFQIVDFTPYGFALVILHGRQSGLGRCKQLVSLRHGFSPFLKQGSELIVLLLQFLVTRCLVLQRVFLLSKIHAPHHKGGADAYDEGSKRYRSCQPGRAWAG